MTKICMILFVVFLPFILLSSSKQVDYESWIRINLLGYRPSNSKVAIWCSKEDQPIKTFQLVDEKRKGLCSLPVRESRLARMDHLRKHTGSIFQNSKRPEYIICR